MSIFREKSLKKVSSPEQIDEYVRVITPSVWIALAALALLLAGFLIWSIFGTMEVHDEKGDLQEIHPITFVVN